MFNQPVNTQNGQSAGLRERQDVIESDDQPVRTREADYIWLDRELVPYDRATVHVLSPTLHYGPGIIEGIRCFDTSRGPAVFRLNEHLERFFLAANAIGAGELGYDVEALRDVVCRVIRANELIDCYVRPMLYFEGPLGLNMDQYRPMVTVAAWEWDSSYGKDAVNEGIRLTGSPIFRQNHNGEMAQIKINGRYSDAVVAKTMAARAGFDEVIIFDLDGFVSGCSGEEILIVRDNVIYAPPRSPSREGITRNTIITLARDSGYTVVEERLTMEQLYSAEEIFVCSTAAGIIPVNEIDNQKIGQDRTGPLTRHLQRLYFETTHGLAKRSLEWLDFMVIDPFV